MGRWDQPSGDEGDSEPLGPDDLDAKVCPTCWRDLAPHQTDCPSCREPAVLRFSLATAVLPAVPTHLRAAGDDDAVDAGAPAPSAPAPSAPAGAAAIADAGAHKPVDDPLVDPAPAELGLPLPLLPPTWGGGVGGGGGDGGC